MKNLSSCLTRGPDNYLYRNTTKGKTLARFLCIVSSTKFLTFRSATALQHTKLLSADFSPPYRFNCLWACSFHFSFHDSRLDIGDRLQHSDHLIVLYAITFVITFIPRLEASILVELKQLRAIRFTLYQH